VLPEELGAESRRENGGIAPALRGGTLSREALVIVCPRCSKENQDHYKFCLGCGAELPREAAKKEFVAKAATTDPPVAPAPAARQPGYDRNLQFAATQQGDAGTALASAGAAPMAAAVAPAPAPRTNAQSAARAALAAAPAPHSCPACGNPVPPDFKFCGTCGHKITPANANANVAPPLAAAPAAAAQPGAQSRGKLVLINPDGSEGSSFPLADGTTAIGRSAGRLFAGDAYLSPQHATFVLAGDNCTVRDEHSLNGVYVKIGRDRPVRLGHGDVFRIGQEIVRYEALPEPQLLDGVEPMGSPNPGYLGRLCLVVGRETIGNTYTIAPDGMHIGRERGDVIFPEDGYVSGLHCRIHHDGSSLVLTDVGSSNGTFVRIRGERKIVSGELLLMGQQLFRIQF
jgi:pSer/pThr/pTyr-binding forkhead associated (FHA) protein